jgi:hypothetical protein
MSIEELGLLIRLLLFIVVLVILIVTVKRYNIPNVYNQPLAWWMSKRLWLSLLKKYLLFILPVVLILSFIENKYGENNSLKSIDNFSDARDIVPGAWLSSEKLWDNNYTYTLLNFDNDGTFLFAQSSDLNFKTKGSLKGNWTINDNPQFLDDLITSKRFLINLSLESYGDEILRVELNDIQHRMGRIRDSNDDLRESSGLFTFGGMIFYKTFTK